MQYMMLMYDREATEPPTDEEMAAWFTYTNDMKEAGVYAGGEALDATHAATTVRVRNGETVQTDGPFADTKEALGGFYVLECADLDEAIRWAAKCPAATSGSIEVRPIIKFD